jgi:hypothetical protein
MDLERFNTFNRKYALPLAVRNSRDESRAPRLRQRFMSTLTRGISGSIHQVYDSESDEIVSEGCGTVASLGPVKGETRRLLHLLPVVPLRLLTDWFHPQAEREAAHARIGAARSCSRTEPTDHNSDVFPGEHN